MEKLGNIYDAQTNFGKIKLTPKGIIIQGKLLTNIVDGPIKIESLGSKTLVTCQFVADSFESIEK